MAYAVPIEYSKLTKAYKKNIDRLEERSRTFFQVLYDPIEDIAFFFRPRIRSLYEREARMNYFRNLRRKFRNLPDQQSYTFSTLTYSTKLYGPEEVALRCKKDIALLMKRLRRAIPKLQYFYIVELTKKFMPHFHIIFNQQIPKRILKKNWLEITGSYIVDIRNIFSEHVYGYMTSELLKSKKQPEQYWQFIYFSFNRLWSSSRMFFLHAKDTTKKYYILFTNPKVINAILFKFLGITREITDVLTPLPKKLRDYLLQVCDGSWSDSIPISIE